MNQLFRTIGWGLYGAASWTWCIGLFLPTILMQWFGWSGFLLIAIPNVIGATMMGLLLGSPSASRRFCLRHPQAIKWFVSITIAFHLVFLSIVAIWIFPAAIRSSWDWVLFPLTALILGQLLSLVPRSWWPLFGTIAVACGGVVIAMNYTCGDPAEWSATRPPIDLLWLSPIFSIGFLLCPWLDAPFHRVRQETQGPLGFVVLGIGFLCRLCVTASYWWLGEGLGTPLVLAWIFGQATFTIAANIRELRDLLPSLKPTATLPREAIAIAVVCIAGLLLVETWAEAKDLYLRWLALYGLFFPAVLLAWCLRRSPRVSIDGAARLIILLAVASVLSNIGLISGPTWIAAVAAILILFTPCVVGRN
jgi:small basic protein